MPGTIEKQREVTIWFDVDGVVKDDIMPLFRKLGLPDESDLKGRGSIRALRVLEETLFSASGLPLNILSMFGVDPTKNAKWMKGIVDEMKGYINAGKEGNVIVSIGLITANRHVDGEELKRELREYGIEAEFVKVPNASAKWKHISKLLGEHFHIDDNPDAFLDYTKEEGKAGVISKTPYYWMRSLVVQKMNEVEVADRKRVRERVLSFIRHDLAES